MGGEVLVIHVAKVIERRVEIRDRIMERIKTKDKSAALSPVEGRKDERRFTAVFISVK
jgi:hypothetical protein